MGRIGMEVGGGNESRGVGGVGAVGGLAYSPMGK